MKKTGFILMLLLACSLASTASALEVIAEARIESATGEPVQEELRLEPRLCGNCPQRPKWQGRWLESGVECRCQSQGVKVLSPADFTQKVAGLSVPLLPMTSKTF